MVLFARANRPAEPPGNLSHWRPMRAALVIACLALSLSALVGTGVLGPELAIAATTSSGPSRPASSDHGCPATVKDEQMITVAQVAQLYTPASGPATLGAASGSSGSNAANVSDISRACLALSPIPQPTTGAPTGPGKVILISRSQQWLWAYQNGKLLFATPVATGQPDLPTPLGTFHIMRKESNTMFYSPWPKSSPYYYAPLHIDYALLFRAGGFYIHDAPWRYDFGPGANFAHSLPDGAPETGSHGCVDVPVQAGAWLYAWAGTGTRIVIVDDGQTHSTSPVEQSAA